MQPPAVMQPNDTSKVFVHQYLTFKTVLQDDGRYLCLCSLHGTDGDLMTETQLESHFQQWNHTLDEQHRTKSHEAPIHLSDDLIETPTLQTYGLCINEREKLLICITCSSAVLPYNIQKHLQSVHRIQSPNITSYLSDFDLLEEFFPLPSVKRHQIKGLQIHDCIQCNFCPSIYATVASTRTHHSSSHSSEVFPQDSELQYIKCQKLSNSRRSRCYFEVFTPAADPGDRLEPVSYVTGILDKIDSEQNNVTPHADIRNVTPWMRITRWYEILAPYDTATLRRLVSLPNRGEFPLLAKSVTELFTTATEYCNSTSTLVLQILNSPDIEKNGVSNSPYSKFQDHAMRLNTYTLPVQHLLAMLLRRSDEYPITLPSTVEQEVNAVRTAVMGSDVSACANSIFVLLRSIWTKEWIPSASHAVADPTIHYLMLSTLLSNGGFMEPKLFTNVIARLQYTVRAVFLKDMHLSGDISARSAELKPWYQEKMESTFNSLRSLQHIASSIAYATQGVGNVVWLDRENYTELLYHGSSIKLNDITTMLAEMESEMSSIWEKEILCGLGLSVEYGMIHDDLSNTTPGYSFVSDFRNEHIFSNRSRIIDAILLSPILRERFVVLHSGTDLRLNIGELRKWLLAYKNLQTLHITRATLTGGSPCRGTEITAMLYRNTATSPVRNLVFFGPYLSLLCTYQKTSALTKVDKLIPHALDAFGSDLLIQDLAIARPFAEFAYFHCHVESQKTISLYRQHIFVNYDRLFTTDDLTKCLEQWTIKFLGESLGMNSWRHISTAFRRKRCGRMDLLFEKDSIDSVEAAQSGHSRQTENRIYGVSTDALGGSPEDLLDLFVVASTDWQIELRIIPGGLRLPYRRALCAQFDSLVAAGTITVSRPHDPLKKMILDCVAPLFERLSAQITDTLKHFDYKKETISTSELSEFSSAKIDAIDIEHELKPMILSSQSSNSSTETLVVGPELESRALSTLKNLVRNRHATWNSPEQLLSIMTAIDLKQDLLAILPTGSGKSMIAIIPSLLEWNTVTVVIIPLRSLLRDYIARLTPMDVPFEVYKGGPLSGESNLVLVSADAACTPQWAQHIQIVNRKRQVVRQIFDEAHMALIDSDYRDCLSKVYLMRKNLVAQVILMSGSLPPAAEPALKKAFAIGDNVKTIRLSSNRPEIRYDWRDALQEDDLIAEVVALVINHTFDSPHDRGLVFVPSLRLGKSLAEMLSCDLYSSEVDDSGRLRITTSWINGDRPFMICTSAFGAGNDHQRVRVVIHAGTPHHMVNYIQEVSRAGRDGQPSVGIMIPFRQYAEMPAHRPPSKAASSGDVAFGGKKELLAAIRNPAICVRTAISTYTDLTSISCESSSNNQICSRCSSDGSEADDDSFKSTKQASQKRSLVSAFEPATNLAKRRRSSDILEYNAMITLARTTMAMHIDCCMYCWSLEVVTPHHDLYHCELIINNDHWTKYAKFRSSLKYSSGFKVCYRCHVPQGQNFDLHPKFKAGGTDCPFADRIAPLAFGIYHDPHMRTKAGDYFGQDFTRITLENFSVWLTGDLSEKSFVTNLFSLFMWFAHL